MKETNEKQERTRKVRSKNGAREQKMMTFRLDTENADWLNRQPNKGRCINMLIAAARLQDG